MNNSKLEILKKINELLPRKENRGFWFLILLIAFLSVILAIVFTVIVGLGGFQGTWSRISLLGVFIFFSFIVLSTVVVKRITKSNEQLKAPDNIMENIFELAISARVLKILVPIFSGLIIFFGWSDWQEFKKNFKEETKKEIMKEIDPEEYVENLINITNIAETHIDSMKIAITRVENYILPIGTIVAFDGRKGLPYGWAPCDGRIVQINETTNFITPNLVNRFIIGTTYDTPEIPVGDTGGSSAHSHQFQINLDIMTSPNERDSIPPLMKTTIKDPQNYPVIHGHRVRIDTTINSNLDKHLPPYYALIFIIKYR